MSKRVVFHRARAAAWIVLGLASLAFGFADSTVLIWLASVYANVVSDVGAAEAADDGELVDRLERIETILSDLAGCPCRRQ